MICICRWSTVDGEDLAALLKRIGRLPIDKGIEIARKLCAGLAAAHAKGVLHRDFKPANIMIDGHGEVRIMDFGLAAIADELDATDVRSGTPAYMAPEQLAGKEATRQSDLYALGLVLYELFTGKPPFAARDLDELQRLRAASPATTPSTLIPDIGHASSAPSCRASSRTRSSGPHQPLRSPARSWWRSACRSPRGWRDTFPGNGCGSGSNGRAATASCAGAPGRHDRGDSRRGGVDPNHAASRQAAVRRLAGGVGNSVARHHSRARLYATSR